MNEKIDKAIDENLDFIDSLSIGKAEKSISEDEWASTAPNQNCVDVDRENLLSILKTDKLHYNRDNSSNFLQNQNHINNFTKRSCNQSISDRRFEKPFLDMSNLQNNGKYNRGQHKFQNKNWNYKNNSNFQTENKKYSTTKDSVQANSMQSFDIDFESISKNILSTIEDKSVSTFMTEKPIKNSFLNKTDYRKYSSFNTPLLTPHTEKIAEEKRSLEKKYPKLIKKNYISDQTINFVDQYKFEMPCNDMTVFSYKKK